MSELRYIVRVELGEGVGQAVPQAFRVLGSRDEFRNRFARGQNDHNAPPFDTAFRLFSHVVNQALTLRSIYGAKRSGSFSQQIESCSTPLRPRVGSLKNKKYGALA